MPRTYPYGEMSFNGEIMLPGYGAGLEAAHSPAKILLVEDEVLIRAILAEELRDEGLRVVEAASADEAWAYLEAGGHADLVFSDITLPGTMSGLDLAERIKSQYPHMKIIITSGNAGPRNCSKMGLFIAKPYRIDFAAEMTLKTLGIK